MIWYCIVNLGYDFVLIKLSKERGENRAPGRVIPACLPGNNFPEFENKNVYMAGFGRRQTPHCLTDMQGPEKFQVFLTFFTIYLYIHQNSFAWQRHRLNILHLCFSFADVRHGVNTSIEEKIAGLTFLIRMVMKKM